MNNLHHDAEMTMLTSVVTCPACATAKRETMPTDACQFFYDCSGCGIRLKPKAGDCCVFCSYGDVPCPPIQEAKAGGDSCCAPEPAMTPGGCLKP